MLRSWGDKQIYTGHQIWDVAIIYDLPNKTSCQKKVCGHVLEFWFMQVLMLYRLKILAFLKTTYGTFIWMGIKSITVFMKTVYSQMLFVLDSQWSVLKLSKLMGRKLTNSIHVMEWLKQHFHALPYSQVYHLYNGNNSKK